MDHFLKINSVHSTHIDGLVQNCSNSGAFAMEILQSCTKPKMCHCQMYMQAASGTVPSLLALIGSLLWSCCVLPFSWCQYVLGVWVMAEWLAHTTPHHMYVLNWPIQVEVMERIYSQLISLSSSNRIYHPFPLLSHFSVVVSGVVVPLCAIGFIYPGK